VYLPTGRQVGVLVVNYYHAIRAPNHKYEIPEVFLLQCMKWLNNYSTIL